MRSREAPTTAKPCLSRRGFQEPRERQERREEKRRESALRSRLRLERPWYSELSEQIQSYRK